MDLDSNLATSETTSISEYQDAESDAEYFNSIQEISKNNAEPKGSDDERARPSTSSHREELEDSGSNDEAAFQQAEEKRDGDTQDYMQDNEWKLQKKHIFILSEAGKPIYSLHGHEDRLATLFGIIQALVSFVQHGQDAITSIHTNHMKFVFLVRGSLILVAASRAKISVQQLSMQLSDVYNQILSILTHSHMNKIFEQRKNFDLRRLLAGSERLIHHLLTNDSLYDKVSNDIFTSLLNSVRVLSLPVNVRTSITNAIQSSCSKIKNLVFAIMIANNQLVTLVRMKKYSIHPSDLRLIFNLIQCSESFKTSENWTPICLPKFDMNGFLHAHVSYVTENCPACLLLLSVDRDDFFTLSDAKNRIAEKMEKANCFKPINEEILKEKTRLSLNHIGLPEMRHFIYKPKALTQLICAHLQPPYDTPAEFARLHSIYYDLLARIHRSSRPLKLIYEVGDREIVLAWVTAGYELYGVFEPMIEKSTVIKYVDKLIKWIEKENDVLFIRTHPTF